MALPKEESRQHTIHSFTLMNLEGVQHKGTRILREGLHTCPVFL